MLLRSVCSALVTMELPATFFRLAATSTRDFLSGSEGVASATERQSADSDWSSAQRDFREATFVFLITRVMHGLALLAPRGTRKLLPLACAPRRRSPLETFAAPPTVDYYWFISV